MDKLNIISKDKLVKLKILVSTKAQLGFSMHLILSSLLLFLKTITDGLLLRPSPSLARLLVCSHCYSCLIIHLNGLTLNQYAIKIFWPALV